MRAASGSCERRRMVVSTSAGTETPSGPRDVAPLARVDLDAVADVDEERHLHRRAGLELRRLRHVRDRIPLHARLRLDDGELDGGGKVDPRRTSVDEEE